MQRSRVLRVYTCVCLPRFNSGGGYNGGAGRFDPYGELFIATIHHFLPTYILLPARAFVSSHTLSPGPALRHHDWELALQIMMFCLTQFLTPWQCLQAAAMVSAEDGAGFSREVLNRETSRTSRTMVVEAGEAAAAAEEVAAAAEEVEAAAEEEEVFFFQFPMIFL